MWILENWYWTAESLRNYSRFFGDCRTITVTFQWYWYGMIWAWYGQRLKLGSSGILPKWPFDIPKFGLSLFSIDIGIITKFWVYIPFGIIPLKFAGAPFSDGPGKGCPRAMKWFLLLCWSPDESNLTIQQISWANWGEPATLGQKKQDKTSLESLDPLIISDYWVDHGWSIAVASKTMNSPWAVLSKRFWNDTNKKPQSALRTAGCFFCLTWTTLSLKKLV